MNREPRKKCPRCKDRGVLKRHWSFVETCPVCQGKCRVRMDNVTL